MIPPSSIRNLLRGLPTQETGAGRPGPTMAARRAQIPQDVEGTWPATPRGMTPDEMINMASDVATPLGAVAGATRKVAGEAIERVPTLWHGTDAAPFAKFLREKMGAGLNKLGVGGYGTDQLREGLDYISTKTQNAPSHIITRKGQQLEVPIETATLLRSGDLSLEDEIARRQKHLKMQEDRMAKFKNPKLLGRMREDIENSRSTLYNLLTAADEGIADINRPGSLLELQADVDPNMLLNYDKDLIDQTPMVQDALRSALRFEGAISPRNMDQQFKFNNLLNSKIRTREGTRALEDAGIQGVVAGSSMNPSTTNYAIFDPDRIAVLRNLGLLGMLTGGAVSRRTPTTPPQREP